MIPNESLFSPASRYSSSTRIRGGGVSSPSSAAGRPIVVSTMAMQATIQLESALLLAREYIKSWWNKFHDESWQKSLFAPVTTFLSRQNSAAETRRGVYQQRPGARKASTRLLQPQRVLQLSALALLLSESIFFCGTRVELLYASAKPTIAAWWTRGRSEHGLFNRTTWTSSSSSSSSSSHNNASVIQAAWDQQFAPKYQWAVGCAVGMIVSPAAWSLGGTTAELLAVAYVAAELNHAVGWYLLYLLDRISPELAEAWGRMDAALETLRCKVLLAIKEPVRMWQNIVPQALMVPKVLRKGLLTGTILGYLLGA
jgi:hypothetical protein